MLQFNLIFTTVAAQRFAFHSEIAGNTLQWYSLEDGRVFRDCHLYGQDFVSATKYAFGQAGK